MARNRTPRTPKFRHHKASGQGFVEIAGKRHYLGKWGLPATEQAYHRAVAEWLANDRTAVLKVDPSTITVLELCAAYWQHVERTYTRSTNFRPMLKVMRRLYGESPCRTFGPLALKAVREAMIAAGWSRRYVNKNVKRIQAMFRWAKNEQLIPPSVYDGIRDVPGLRAGQTEAPETAPVGPCPDEWVDAVKPYVSRQVWAMIEVQRYTGARPGEVCMMRPVDIDTSRSTWLYRPTTHKMAYRGQSRIIGLGPKARTVIGPFLTDRRVDAFLFSPREADAERRERLRAKRRTPASCGNGPGTNCRDHPQRQPGECYTTNTYAQAITRAVKAAFRPKGMTDADFAEWDCPQHWSPNQIRHAKGTQLRKAEGLEHARVYLGHSKVETTQIYAEQDEAKMMELAEKYG